MDDQAKRIQLRRKLSTLLPEMRSIPLEDLINNQPLKWIIKQRILIILFEKTPLLQEQYNNLQDLLEERNKYLAERRNKGLNNIKKEINSEKEALFRTDFMRLIISGLERMKWPTASIPFSDPLNDLLHDDNTFVDGVDFLINMIDPSLQYQINVIDSIPPPSSSGIAIPPSPSRNTSMLDDSISSSHMTPKAMSTPNSALPTGSGRRSIESSTAPPNTGSSRKSTGVGRPLATYIADSSMMSITSSTPGGFRDDTSTASTPHSVASSRFGLKSRLDQSTDSNNDGFCSKCQSKFIQLQKQQQAKAHPTVQMMEILQTQNKHLRMEVRRLTQIIEKREHSHTALHDCSKLIRQAIEVYPSTDDSVSTTTTPIPATPSTSRSLGGSPIKSSSIINGKQQLSKSLQMIERMIHQDSTSLQKQSQKTTEHTIDFNNLSSCSPQETYDHRLHGESLAFPYDEESRNDLRLMYNELLRLAEVMNNGKLIDDNDMNSSRSIAGVADIDNDSNNFNGRWRNMRMLAFRISMRIARMTGQGTIASEDMERSSIWKLNQLLANTDRKAIPKHILSSITKECDGILSEFNLINNSIKIFFGKEKKWGILCKQILSSLSSIRKHLQSFGKTFQEEIAPSLKNVGIIVNAFQAVNKAKIMDRKTGSQRSVIDLLLNGAMGVEVAEWLMIFKEHNESVSNLSTTIETSIVHVSKQVDSEVVKLATLLKNS